MSARHWYALSFTQPYAWACIYAGKDIENRDWPTRFRGRVFIHAAKGMTRSYYREAQLDIMESALDAGTPVVVPSPASLPRGAIIGSVDLIGDNDKHNSPWRSQRWGNHAFHIINPRPLFTPMFCLGARGFWNIPPEVQSEIERTNSNGYSTLVPGNTLRGTGPMDGRLFDIDIPDLV